MCFFLSVWLNFASWAWFTLACFIYRSTFFVVLVNYQLQNPMANPNGHMKKTDMNYLTFGSQHAWEGYEIKCQVVLNLDVDEWFPILYTESCKGCMHLQWVRRCIGLHWIMWNSCHLFRNSMLCVQYMGVTRTVTNFSHLEHTFQCALVTIFNPWIYLSMCFSDHI